MHRKIILLKINKILWNTCTNCEMKAQLNREHGNTYSKIDGFCNQYCLIGSKLQDLGNQYSQNSRPRKEDSSMYINMRQHKVPQSKYSGITKEFLQAEKDTGKTIKQISKDNNIPIGTLSGLMVKHGISSDKRGPKSKKEIGG
jgi:hypothetical protein